MSKVIVVGGGPAGMFAAIAAAERGHEVVLLEKNEKLGKKLYITGKGRCNITNAGDMDTLFANVMTNPKFLYSAFYDYDNQRVIDFFEENGLATMTAGCGTCLASRCWPRWWNRRRGAAAWDSFMSSGAFTRDCGTGPRRGSFCKRDTPCGPAPFAPKRRRRSWIFCNGGRRAG